MGGHEWWEGMLKIVSPLCQVYYDPIYGYTYGGYEDPYSGYGYGYGYGAYDGYAAAYSGEYAYEGAYPEGYVPETYTEGGEAGTAEGAGEGKEEGEGEGVEDGEGTEGGGEAPPGFEEEAAAAAAVAAAAEAAESARQAAKEAEVDPNGYSIEDQQMSPTGRARPKGADLPTPPPELEAPTSAAYAGIDPWSGLYGDPATYAAYYEAPDGVYTTDPSAYPDVAAVADYETLLTNHIPTWQQVIGRGKGCQFLWFG